MAVGGNDEIRALAAPAGKTMDLRGRTVTPGFTDAHLHFLSYGIGLQEIELAGVLTRWRRWRSWRPAPRHPGRPVADGPRLGSHRCWGQAAHFPTRQDLDRAAPQHPVFLRRKCGHAGWANTRALELAGITAATPDPFGGAIDHDPATGQPTGILKDVAMELMFRLFQETIAG